MAQLTWQVVATPGDLESSDPPGQPTLVLEPLVLYVFKEGTWHAMASLEGSTPPGSEAAAGVLELATSAETLTGTDTARAVHPAGLQDKLDSLGLAGGSETVAGLLELATAAETQAGTDTARATHPAGIMSLVGMAFSTALEGLRIDWQSATQVIVRSGVAWIPGASKLVSLASDVTINFAGGGTTPPVTGTGTLSVNQAGAGWLYLYLNSSGQVRITTTAPAASYRGHAKTMTADTSYRYLGAVYASAANVIRRADRYGGWVRWIADALTTLDIGVGTGTTFADYSLAALKPPHSSRVEVDVHHTNTTNAGRLYVNSDNDGLATVGGTESAPQVSTGNIAPATGNRGAAHGPVASISTSLRCRVTSAGSAAQEVAVQAYFDAVA